MNFFPVKIAATWNQLHENIVSAGTVNTFKIRLDKDWITNPPPNIITDAEGRTALHVAAELNRTDILETLIASGGCPLLHDLSCFSPIDAAAATGATQALALLHNSLLTEMDEEETRRRGAVVINSCSSDGTFYSCASNVVDWVLKCTNSSKVGRSSCGLSSIALTSTSKLPTVCSENNFHGDDMSEKSWIHESTLLSNDSVIADHTTSESEDLSYPSIKKSFVPSVLSSEPCVLTQDILNTAFLKPDGYISFLSNIGSDAQCKPVMLENNFRNSVSNCTENENNGILFKCSLLDVTHTGETSAFHAEEVEKENFNHVSIPYETDEKIQKNVGLKTCNYEYIMPCKRRVDQGLRDRDNKFLCDSDDDAASHLQENTLLNLENPLNCSKLAYTDFNARKRGSYGAFHTSCVTDTSELETVKRRPAMFQPEMMRDQGSRASVLIKNEYEFENQEKTTKILNAKFCAAQDRTKLNTVPATFDILSRVNRSAFAVCKDFTVENNSAGTFQVSGNDISSIEIHGMKTEKKNGEFHICAGERRIPAYLQCRASVCDNDRRTTMTDAAASESVIVVPDFNESISASSYETPKILLDINKKQRTAGEEFKRDKKPTSNSCFSSMETNGGDRSSKIKGLGEASGATSSVSSTVSLVDEYIYEDKPSNVTLIERRGPKVSCCSGGCRSQCSGALSKCMDFSQSQLFSRALTVLDERHQTTDAGENPDSSALTTLPPSIVELSAEALGQQLVTAGSPVSGPITASTARSYGRLLHRLRRDEKQQVAHGGAPAPPSYPRELKQALCKPQCVPWQRYVKLEEIMSSSFTRPRLVDYWRGGTARVCFNYLLLDPSVTCDLPLRVCSLSPVELLRIFVSGIFYVGKGTRSRPYAHLYEALKLYNATQQKDDCNAQRGSAQAERIAALWRAGYGVVSLHLYHHSISAEAHTREAAIIDAIGVTQLCNKVRGTYYGPAYSFKPHERRCLGVLLLHRALVLFLCEGERLIRPPDLPPNPWTSKK
ncbi:Ankyrin repeat-containing domain [Trinorchestia longiramus]|nr:Ankyrin repeat-containing domain [Trinorchestia longiramus]